MSRPARSPGQQMLEVIQDEQELPLTQLADQVLNQRPVPDILQPDALGDRPRHQPTIPDRRQPDEEHPSGYSAATSAASAMHSRVLPLLPGPVSVTRQLPWSSRLACASSRSLPMKPIDKRLGQAAAAGIAIDGAARQQVHRTSRRQACLYQPGERDETGGLAAGDGPGRATLPRQPRLCSPGMHRKNVI